MYPMQLWTSDMIRFMNDASKFTNYFKILATKIRKIFPKAASICDAGCGTGGLALELSPFFEKVYAIDINQNAINSLNNSIKSKKITNIHTSVSDLLSPLSLPYAPFDVMVYSYFGSVSEAIAITRKCGTKNMAIIRRKNLKHRFSFSEVPVKGHSTENWQELLKKECITFRTEDLDVEFGQPFKNMEDAFLFFNLYSADKDKNMINIENISKRLITMNSNDFSFYMPQKRSCTLITSHF